jgi:hypothetical protein
MTPFTDIQNSYFSRMYTHLALQPFEASYAFSIELENIDALLLS